MIDVIDKEQMYDSVTRLWVEKRLVVKIGIQMKLY